MEPELSRVPLNSDGTFGPYSRLRCTCCGAPTLTVDVLSDPPVVLTPVCLLCEWENQSDVAGEQSTVADDGVSLAEARANFDRFCWMYDPSTPQPWMQALPSRDELQARAGLRAIYRSIDREADVAEFERLWEEARAAEEIVERFARARERAVEPTAAEVDADDTETFEI